MELEVCIFVSQNICNVEPKKNYSSLVILTLTLALLFLDLPNKLARRCPVIVSLIQQPFTLEQHKYLVLKTYCLTTKTLKYLCYQKVNAYIKSKTTVTLRNHIFCNGHIYLIALNTQNAHTNKCIFLSNLCIFSCIYFSFYINVASRCPVFVSII